MKISDLELCLVEIPCGGEPALVRSLLVRVAADSGLYGWGETALEDRAGSTASVWRPGVAAVWRDLLLPMLSGRSVFEVEELLRLDVLQDRGLAAAVEMACWDLIGKSARQPLCHLSGGGYRRRIPLAARLALRGPRETADLAREMADRGFYSQVITASGQLDDDLQTARAVSEATAGRADVQFDGRSLFAFSAAGELCGELERLGIAAVLDPLRGDDLEQLSILRRRANVRLGVSNAIRSPADVLAVVRSGAATLISVDPRRVGGMLGTRKCAAVAEAAKLGMSLTCAPSLGVALAAMLHLASAIPNLDAAHHTAYHDLRDDVLIEPHEIVDGMLPIPSAPGLGIDVSRQKLDQYQIG